MVRRIEDIFNECLERINQGDSIENCLADYPEAAEELQYLLGTFVNVRWRASLAQPSPGFKTWGRNQLLNMQQQHAPVKEVSRPSIFSIQRVWVPLMAGLMIFILIGSVGTAAASNSAMPDQPLYPVKIATEQMRLVFALSEEDKAVVNSQIAETRSQEIVVMASEGKTTQVEATTARMIKNMDDAETAMNNVILQETANVTPSVTSEPTLTTPPEPSSEQPPDNSQATANTSRNKSSERVKERVKISINKNVNVMENVLDKVPQEAKPAIQRAINAAKLRQEKIEKFDTNNIVIPENQGKDNSGSDSGTKNYDGINKHRPGIDPTRQGDDSKNDAGNDLSKDQDTSQTIPQDSTTNRGDTDTVLPPKDNTNIVIPPKDDSNVILPPKDDGNTLLPPKDNSVINIPRTTIDTIQVPPSLKSYTPVLDFRK